MVDGDEWTLTVNPTNLVEKLMSIGINPISGPHIDGTPLNIFTRSSTFKVRDYDLNGIKDYPTKTGRRNKTNTLNNPEKNEFFSLREAANKLNISPNKTAVLVQKGILTKDQTNSTSIMIHKTSLQSLIHKLVNSEFIEVNIAAIRLNCSLNWLYEYWCKSGYLNVDDLIYWKLIDRRELNEILKLKEEYLTGAEASALLGMPHSHISNLQKQGIIQAYYMGNTEHKVRLFKQTDVLQLKNAD